MTREFFAAYTVSELEGQSDYWLEEQGREPMRYNGATDRYEPIGSERRFDLIGTLLARSRVPTGRTSTRRATKTGMGHSDRTSPTSSFAPASQKTPKLEIRQRCNSQQSGATTSTIRRSTASIDRYRGVFGGRMVVFMNEDDMTAGSTPTRPSKWPSVKITGDALIYRHF